MDDLTVALEELREESSSQPSAPVGLLSRTPRRWPWAAAGVLLLGGVALWRAQQAPSPTPAVVGHHVTAEGLRGIVLAGGDPGRVRLGRGRRGQLGHLAEDRGRGRGAPVDERFRVRELPRLVPRRQADRVHTTRLRSRRMDEHVLSVRAHPRRLTPRRGDEAPVRLRGAPAALVVAGRPVAGGDTGSPRAARDPPRLRGDGGGAARHVAEGAALRRQPGLLARRARARLRLLLRIGVQPGLRRRRARPRRAAATGWRAAHAHPAGPVEPRRGLDAGRPGDRLQREPRAVPLARARRRQLGARAPGDRGPRRGGTERREQPRQARLLAQPLGP